MYDALSLKLLANADLAPDWMTLCVGVRGVELGTADTANLSFDDVQEFAIDQLALVAGTPDEWDVYRIADADPVRTSANVDDILRDLAKRMSVPVDLALRKWRHAAIFEGVETIEIGNWTHFRKYDETDEWEARGGRLHSLLTQWEGVCKENAPPEVGLEWDEEPVHANLTAVKTWLSHEREAIIAEETRLTRGTGNATR